MQNNLTMHFVDGSKLSLDFPSATENPAARKLRIADFLTSKHLVVEAEGSVLVFPVANIKYLAFSTTGQAAAKGVVGGALPRHTLFGARIRS